MREGVGRRQKKIKMWNRYIKSGVNGSETLSIGWDEEGCEVKYQDITIMD